MRFEDWLSAQSAAAAAPTQGGRTYCCMHLLDLELFTACVAYSSLRFIVDYNDSLSDIPSVYIVRNKSMRIYRFLEFLIVEIGLRARFISLCMYKLN